MSVALRNVLKDRGIVAAPDAPPPWETPIELYEDETAAPAARQLNGHQRDAKPPAEPARQPIPLLGLLWYAKMAEVSHAPQLVKRLLLAASLFVVFGESNSGKTFWILDLALALASGRRKWRGRPCMQGLVIYIAGEGAASVRMRVAAFRASNPDLAAGLPFAIIPQPVNLLDAVAVEGLIATIQAAQSECGEQVVLVIFDTFARSIPGGNENDAQDVGIAVAAGDHIRTATGAAVAFIHHAGKDPTKGARGSSALRAACDTEIFIEGQTGQRIATVSKQRDLEAGDPMPFELVAVPLGTDPDGEPITSCVVKHLEGEAMPQRPKGPGKNEQRAIVALKEWARVNPDAEHVTSIAIRAMFKAQGIARQRHAEVLNYLVNAGILTPSIGGHTFNRGML